MSLKLYMDVHVHGAVTAGLRRRGIDVLTAQDDGADELTDPALLDRASELGRLLFTNDTDFLSEAQRRMIVGEPLAGVVFAHLRDLDIGGWIEDLELIAAATDLDAYSGRVEYLPLR